MTTALILLGIVFIVLKLASVVTWSWLIVLIPFAACVLMWLAIFAISVFAATMHERSKRKFIASFAPEQREFAERMWNSKNV